MDPVVAMDGGGMTMANIIGGLIFGSIGFVAFIYGKKMHSFKPMLIGMTLIIYPYMVPQTGPMIAIGAGLTAALFFWRD